MAMFEAFLVQDLVLTQGLSEQGVSHCDERLRAMCWVFWRCGTHRPEGARIWGRVAFPPLYRPAPSGPRASSLNVAYFGFGITPGETSLVRTLSPQVAMWWPNLVRGNYKWRAHCGATTACRLVWEQLEKHPSGNSQKHLVQIIAKGPGVPVNKSVKTRPFDCVC